MNHFQSSGDECFQLSGCDHDGIRIGIRVVVKLTGVVV